MPPDEPAGQNPPDGAIIDYWLAQPASGAVTIEILDSAGKLVRRYSSADQPEVNEEELKKTATIPVYWIRMPKTLSADAGMHRWVWDLHYPLPARRGTITPSRPFLTTRRVCRSARRRCPGQYTVRLTANGHTFTAPLTVKMDPRVKTTPAGLQQQFRLETRLAEMMTRSFEAITQANAVREQLQKISGQASGATADAIKHSIRNSRPSPEEEAEDSSHRLRPKPRSGE